MASFGRTAALRELIVRAVALSDRADDNGELAALVERAPVEALREAAWSHHVSGTVERSLRRVDGVPDHVLEDLRADAETDALKGLALLAALHDVAAEFDRLDITWLTMKGPVLAHRFYTRPGDRGYVDLDLLVDRTHLQVAVEALEAMGYEHQMHNWRLATQMMAGEIQLDAGATRIDLHWHLHYSTADREGTALAPEQMLERARRVELPGGDVPTFDPVDTVINLAYHAARSDGHRLMWLKDLERALAVDDPDLVEVVRRAHGYQCGPQVGVMLRRVRDVLDVEVPDDVIEALLPAVLGAIDRGAGRLSNPTQFHDRTTISRFVTRSLGRSTAATFAALPTRAARLARRRLRPSEVNETDDADEKQQFFDAIAASSR